MLKGIDMKINELSRSQQVDEVPAGGLSQLGNEVGFIGKVSDDDLGNKLILLCKLP